jgi:hypothetical protein
MYLIYTDESGDPGRSGREEFLVLSTLMVHERRWHDCFNQIKQLRGTLRTEYGIARNSELHANRNIAGRGVMWGKRWAIEERIRLFQLVLESISEMPGARTMSVCIRKTASQFVGQKGRAIHDTAWTFLLQRFHNFAIQQRAGDTNGYGIVFHDTGHDVEIRKLMRKLRVYNYVPSHFGPSRNVPLTSLIEDPVSRDSAHSQFVQLVDYIAYSVLRHESPVARYPGLESVYHLLQPVILEEAASDNQLGLIRYPKDSA